MFEDFEYSLVVPDTSGNSSVVIGGVMNRFSVTGFLVSMVLAANALAAPPKVYLNENVGFNVKGFKYAQKAFPCEVDKKLIVSLLDQGKKQNIPMELAGTAEKLRNGTIPVIAVDIEQLALGKEGFNYSHSKNNSLPMIQATAAIIKGKDVITSKHTCAFATLNEFTPATSVLDLGTTTTVCRAMRKCVGDLGKDIMTWASSELK
ncbi:MAG: hypothetical protein EOO68_08410 [Moraxellaceae bacterium]|nr:MAG: hypothetical protein EOO68_08410 [Moraxellaceae bacterium]